MHAADCCGGAQVCCGASLARRSPLPFGMHSYLGYTVDNLQVFYKIDNNLEKLWLDIQGDQYSSTEQITVISGSQLTIRTIGRTTHSSETYQIPNFDVSAVQAPTTPSPTVSPAPSLPPGSTCNVPWIGPDYNIGVAGLSDVQIIDTSCAGDVTMSMSINHLGSLETSGSALDTLQVFYQIDSNLEQVWLNIQGDQYSNTAEITVASGAQLTIRVVGDTSASSEVYLIRNFGVAAS